MAPLTPVSYASMEGTGPSPFLCEGVATADYIAIPKVNQWSNLYNLTIQYWHCYPNVFHNCMYIAHQELCSMLGLLLQATNVFTIYLYT